MIKKLHVGLVTVACSPTQGSELELGWKAVLALSKTHRLTVFVHVNHKEEFDAYLKTPEAPLALPDVRFVFVGTTYQHSRNQAIARLLTWHYYRLWLDDCIGEIKSVNQDDPLDLIHHVTYSTWRMGSPFYKVGVPTVWGPVGGAGKVPFSAFGMLSKEAKATEGLRTLISKLYSCLPAFRKSLELNTVVLASNQETKNFLENFSARPVDVIFPTYFAVPDAEVEKPVNADGSRLRCFFGGGIIGSKGIALSFRAIALVKSKGLSIDFKIAGVGPETEYLKSLAAELGIEDSVTFLPLLKGDEYQKILRDGEVFLFPSFRENIGMTMVESMLNHMAPIVLDTSAPGEIVTPECGWKIPVAANFLIVEGIADALIKAGSDRQLLHQKGEAAKNRILSSYSQERYLAHLKDAYLSALSSHHSISKQ